VLDVGCGPGLLAIPMAKKCKKVTGLDSSSEMLKYLKQNAQREKVDNIVYVNKKFEETVIGQDIKKHDLVVASRSMGWERDLRLFLANMDKAAKKRAYIVWGAGDRPFDIGMYNAIGRPYGETRTYIILYNLLYQMGIRANIEVFQTIPTGMSYKSVDDAVESIRKRFEKRGNHEELTSEELKKLQKYFTETLKQTNDGTFRFANKASTRQALIWWKKTPPNNQR
jgi:ubiquinone/menaquinone biosynthesis C-methylase UbiE